MLFALAQASPPAQMYFSPLIYVAGGFFTAAAIFAVIFLGKK